MRYASTWKWAAGVETYNVTRWPALAYVASAKPSIAFEAPGVIAHDAVPERAFSRTMADDTTPYRPRVVVGCAVTRCVGVRVGDGVDVGSVDGAGCVADTDGLGRPPLPTNHTTPAASSTTTATRVATGPAIDGCPRRVEVVVDETLERRRRRARRCTVSGVLATPSRSVRTP
jgi:hypothetical protein